MSGWDVCVECAAKVLTHKNSDWAIDQRSLTPLHMPKGGCQCGIYEENPACAVRYPAEIRCYNHPPNLQENFSFKEPGQLELHLGAAE